MRLRANGVTQTAQGKGGKGGHREVPSAGLLHLGSNSRNAQRLLVMIIV